MAEPKQLAPDGGPLSDFRPSTVKYPTMRVKLKDGGNTVVIRKSDFNEAIHTRISPKRVSLKDDDEKKEEVKHGTESRDELLTLTIEELQAKPEWEEADQSAKTKEEIVDAILAVRE